MRGKTRANVAQKKQRHTGNGRFPLRRTSRARIQVDISDVLTRALTDVMFSLDRRSYIRCKIRCSNFQGLIVGAKTPPTRDKLEDNYWHRRRRRRQRRSTLGKKIIIHQERNIGVPTAITDAKKSERLANGFGSSVHLKF